jgi:hypothetical protein
MNRLAFVSTINYLFGKTTTPAPAPTAPNSPNVISDLIQTGGE